MNQWQVLLQVFVWLLYFQSEDSLTTVLLTVDRDNDWIHRALECVKHAIDIWKTYSEQKALLCISIDIKLLGDLLMVGKKVKTIYDSLKISQIDNLVTWINRHKVIFKWTLY